MDTIATDGTRFCRVLERLAASSEGWGSEVAGEFVQLMSEVLERKAEWLRTEGRVEGTLAEPADVVSEAIFVVDGPAGVPLAENVRRILHMDKPLGYVIGAVSANLSRDVLAGRMGVGSRQITGGASAVLHLDELARTSESDPLDRLSAVPAWAGGQGEGSRDARLTVSSFVSVLSQRFKIRPEISRRGLEVAGTAALEGDTGVGMTPATTRRRVSRFMKELPVLRGSFDRAQAQAFAWLLFGTERHPEWSLLAECARAAREGDAVKVSPWHARNARTVAARPGQVRRETGRQPALFAAPVETVRPSRMTA